jgi:hypothetical protein
MSIHELSQLNGASHRAGSAGLAQYAHLLLKNGYSPVPIEPHDKRPLAALGNWDRLRTTPLTPSEITQIYAKYPTAGLGVAGGYNGLVPIDDDTDDPEISAAVDPVLPVPLVSKRGRRGATQFCRDPSGLIKACKFKKPDNTMLVEVLVTGQTLVPPTIHPETRQPYVYLTDYTLLDVHVDELPELPVDFIERLEIALRPWLPSTTYARPKGNGSGNGVRPVSDERMRKYAEVALNDEARQLRATPEGGRNPQLFDAGCRLGKYVHHGVLTEGELRSALLDAAQANGLIGDDGLKACQDTLSSALRKSEHDELPILDDRPFSTANGWANGASNGHAHAADPRPDMSIIRRNQIAAVPFPLDVLGPAADWVLTTAESKSAPVDYVGLGLLVTAASLIGPKRRVSPWDGWDEPSILWGGLVGPPSQHKSPSLDPLRDAVRSLERDLNRDWEATKAQYEREKNVAEARRKVWEQSVTAAVKKGADVPELPDGANPPKSPTKTRIWIVDATPEKVARILGENPGGLVCFRDELAGLLGGFDKYGGSGSDRAFWIEAYGGRSYRYDRVGLKDGESIDIQFCAVSLLGGIQPDRLYTMVLSGDDDGLASRPLYAWPDPVASRRPYRVADNSALLAALRRLSAIEFERNADDSVRARTILLEPNAADDFQAWWEHKQWDAKLSVTGRLAGAVGKLDGNTLRLALVLELLGWAWRQSNTPEPERISQQSVLGAMRIIDDWVRPNLERVFAEASLPQAQRDAMTIARWLLKTKPEMINARDLRRQAGFPGPKTPKELDEALEVLSDARWLIQQPSGDGPGRKRKDFAINRAIYEGLL